MGIVVALLGGAGIGAVLMALLRRRTKPADVEVAAAVLAETKHDMEVLHTQANLMFDEALRMVTSGVSS